MSKEYVKYYTATSKERKGWKEEIDEGNNGKIMEKRKREEAKKRNIKQCLGHRNW